MINSYLDYKRLTEKAESFSLDERVTANNELEKFKSKEPGQAFYYSKWLQEEKAGINPITGKAVNEPVSKPVEPVKPVKAVNSTKERRKPVGRPTMSYEKFKKTFNKMCSDARLLNNDGKNPIRVLSEFRNANPNLYDQYKQRMAEED